jgi:hypothetical protein
MRLSRVQTASPVLALACAAMCGCATVATPVLRHQTGETLGQNHYRAYGHLERGRIYAPSTTAETVGFEQKNDIYQSTVIGVVGEAGLFSRFDLQGGASFSSSGGGWRIGGKYQLSQKGNIAYAVVAGYSASSGSGKVQYTTEFGTTDISQTLSATVYDVTFPVSYRVSPDLLAYSGLMFLRSRVTGVFNNIGVSDASFNPGINIGFKARKGIFEGDVEIASLWLHDPFSDSSRLVPYFGGSLGVIF